MNSAEHKAKAESLIEEYATRFTASATFRARNYASDLLSLAQVHATLANVKDAKPEKSVHDIYRPRN